MEMFRQCGFPAFVVLAGALCALAVSIVALVVAALSRRFGVGLGIAALALALVVPAVGVGGTVWGRNMTETAIASGVDPAHHARLREMGYQEAQSCTTLGVVTGGLPLVLALSACAVGVLRRRVPNRTA